MLEKLYTTKMSAERKSLQRRFSKIRSKSGRASRLMALIIFVVILLVMACATIIIAANVNNNEFTMTENEYSDYINRPFGAVMADIDYADDNKIVFHYGSGLFVINHQTGEIQLAMSIPKFNVSQSQQGSNVLDVKIDRDGKYAYLSSAGAADEIKGYDEYIINLDNGKVEKGAMPKSTKLFSGLADTLGMVQNPVGIYSSRCVAGGGKVYYLASETGQIRDMQLVVINAGDGRGDAMYLFKEENISKTQRKSDLIHETLADDEEILVNSAWSWDVNADMVKSVFNKLNETRQMPYIDIKDGNYDITIYHIWKNDADIPRLYVIDTHNMELIFSMTLSKDEYFEINKLIYESKNKDTEALTSADNAKEAVISFYEAFSKSDFELMKALGTDNLPIDTVLKMCYGLTKAELVSVEEVDNDEFLAEYLVSDDHKLLEKLTDDEIRLLKQNSDVLKVYTVTVNAESNIKGEIKPPFEKTYKVMCRKQPDTGVYLIDTFFG